MNIQGAELSSPLHPGKHICITDFMQRLCCVSSTLGLFFMAPHALPPSLLLMLQMHVLQACKHCSFASYAPLYAVGCTLRRLGKDAAGRKGKGTCVLLLQLYSLIYLH